jgi:hypothetical protein
VHDLLAHVDRCAVQVERLLHGDHGPVDARAVTTRRGKEHRTLGVLGREDRGRAQIDAHGASLRNDGRPAQVRRLREKFPHLEDPPSDDICYATQNRQVAVKEIAKEADLVIVVGSANSSNSVRLVEVALENGASASYRIDDVTEIDDAWLDGVEKVGVTSGASVPDDLVQDVLAYLAEHGHPDAAAVRTAEESLTFSLPPELRRDMKLAEQNAR